jgi:hypothetical protein
MYTDLGEKGIKFGSSEWIILKSVNQAIEKPIYHSTINDEDSQIKLSQILSFTIVEGINNILMQVEI